MRINQLLAFNLGISRREGDEYIKQGLVKIDNQPATLGQTVSLGQIVEVKHKNKWIKLNQDNQTQTVLFYKPIFSLTSRQPEGSKKTIYSYLPKKYHHLKPAGRLDYMSEGLLVLSNDGELIQKLTHPRNTTKKSYLVGTKKPLTREFIMQSQKGIKIDKYTLNPVEIVELTNDNYYKYKFLNLQKNLNWYKFILSEGRNNQIRRMVAKTNQKVQRLIRIEQGGFKLTKELKIKKIINKTK